MVLLEVNPRKETGKKVMLIEMEVASLAIDPTLNMPLVILKEKDGPKTLPIWIGLLEAGAIATKLQNIDFARPLTHDLMRDMLEAIGARVEKIVVNDLMSGTYYARIILRAGERTLEFDARPSDSIALALRVGAPIFVESSVIEKSQTIDLSDKQSILSDKEKMMEILESMDLDDFGKYKM